MLGCPVQVVAQLVGEEKLPWEGKGREKEMLRNAGRFKGAVLGLLRRDPAQRARVHTFVQQYASIMSTTTQQQFPHRGEGEMIAEGTHTSYQTAYSETAD